MSNKSLYLDKLTSVNPSNFSSPKAVNLVRAFSQDLIQFATLVECLESIDQEVDVVIIKIEPQLCQKRINPINCEEILALEFDKNDRTRPQVYVLRDDFPSVPHLNVVSKTLPKALCLTEIPYDEDRRYWTPARFIESIRRWLTLTASGQLHDEDQALEPVFLRSTAPIFLSSEILGRDTNSFGIELKVIGLPSMPLGYRAINVDLSNPENSHNGNDNRYFGLIIKLQDQEHGIIDHVPDTLNDLHELCLKSGVNLLSNIRKYLTDLPDALNSKAYRLILIVLFPLTRFKGGEVETTKTYAFLVSQPVSEIGIAINLWGRVPGSDELGTLMDPSDDHKAETIGVELLNVYFNLSKKSAALLNGFKKSSDIKITAVGAGALGSQVISNLYRSGMGTWTIIDKDFMLPHNFARHSLDFYLCHPKADALAYSLGVMMPDEPPVKSIVADILAPYGKKAEDLAESLADAEIILDLSASSGVSRYLAAQGNYLGRRISLFLSPQGTDLICLAEDFRRHIKLDHLEVQYYKALIENPALKELLNPPKQYRYGQTCGDLSSTIPQDYVAISSAIGSRAIHNLIEDTDASIAIWRINPKDLTVKLFKIPSNTMEEFNIGSWHLLIDSTLSDKVKLLRQEALPQETGGVLIGSWDVEKKLIYIVDIIPAPPDSKKQPDLFIRGCTGLVDKVEDVKKSTLGQLEYVGEWHSHPSGVSTDPSTTDQILLNWLNTYMKQEGLIGVMMIAGDNNECRWLLGEEV